MKRLTKIESVYTVNTRFITLLLAVFLFAGVTLLGSPLRRASADTMPVEYNTTSPTPSQTNAVTTLNEVEGDTIDGIVNGDYVENNIVPLSITDNLEDDGGIINGDFIDFHGQKLAPNQLVDFYYLTIDFAKHNSKGDFLANAVKNGSLSYRLPTGRQEITLACRFNNLVYTKKVKDNNGNPVLDSSGNVKTKNYNIRLFINVVVDVKVRNPMTQSVNIVFKENVTTSLSNNLYKWLKYENKSGSDFYNMSILATWTSMGQEYGTQIYKAYGALFVYWKWYTFDFNCTLDTKPIKAEELDPSHPDFDIGLGDSGDNESPVDPDPIITEKEPFDFWAWFTTSLAGENGAFLQGVAWVLAVVVALIALIAIGYFLKVLVFIGNLFGSLFK